MYGTPLPLTVWAMITEGQPVVMAALRKACRMAGMSWPSISATAQPKLLHLAASGSSFMIASLEASLCSLL